jgi:hypothetical protein
MELIEHGRTDLRIYLTHNVELERLLFDRNLMGVEFRSACLQSSRRFIQHLADEYSSDETAELIILSKGLMYQLGQAVSDELGYNLPTNLIATSRVAVSHASVRVEVSYAQIEAPARTLIIGDTVASGATIVAALDRYLATHRLDSLYVLSYAGTAIGAERVARFCANRGITSTFIFGLAAFGLGANGFDLSFLHSQTITREPYKERARRQFSGRAVSAVGWDFGAQAMAPQKYRRLCWVEAETWNLQGSDCLGIAEDPGADWSDLAHERSAYLADPQTDGIRIHPDAL